jgi:hypothetical protein
MKRSVKSTLTSIALVSIMGSNVMGAEFFSDKGSIWTGGSISFISQHVRPDSVATNGFLLVPTFRFFPVKYLMVGSSLTLRSAAWGKYSSSSISIGPELGFAYGNNIPVFPYILFSIQYFHSAYTFESYSDYDNPATTTSMFNGYIIPLSGGIMIPVFDGLGFQVEAAYLYEHYGSGFFKQEIGLFRLSIGVCGIGKKIAISFLNILQTIGN